MEYIKIFEGCKDYTRAVGMDYIHIIIQNSDSKQVHSIDMNLFGKALSELSVFNVCICHHCLWPFLITDVVMHKCAFSSCGFGESARSFQENKQFVLLRKRVGFHLKDLNVLRFLVS